MQRRLFLIVVLTIVIVSQTTVLFARSLTIESFHSDINVFPDGTIRVDEKIRFRFSGSWNGIYRKIPVQYHTPMGFSYRLWLQLESITDETGRDLRYESSREGSYRKFKVWVPGANNAVRTVVLGYRVKNALRFFEEKEDFGESRDELYWNVTGTEWEMPIEHASASVYVPEGITGLRGVAFTGAYGSSEQAARIEVGQRYAEFETTRPLGFRQGLTIAVTWNAGVVKRPGVWDRTALFLRSNWVLGFPLLIFPFMFWLWHSRGRDPRRRPIATRYEPPQGLTPAELGTLVDNSPDMRDVTATLVDLAVRGYLLIEEKEKEQWLGLFSKKDYGFKLQNTDWKDLESHERRLLEALFDGGRSSSVELSDLENSFYKDLPSIRDCIFEQVIARRYYTRRPDKVKKVYLVSAAIIGGVVLLAGVLLGLGLGLSPMSVILSGLLSGGIVGVFGWYMPARTISGARAVEGVLGFQEFLERVESDRLERMVETPEMFEKYLPFAMALGVENKWAETFKDIYKEPPDWYRGGDFATFHTRSFASNLGRMSTQASSVMASSPRSSGGGGGFSGGGFGGGGGGGFEFKKGTVYFFPFF